MTTLTDDDLKCLADAESAFCVSIFLPTSTNGNNRDVEVQLKQLFDQATSKLIDRGLRKPQAKRVMDPARQMSLDPGFWTDRGKGLAVFVSDDLQGVYHLRNEAGPSVMVSQRFQITPLLRSLIQSRFFILTLSQNRPRLLRCGETEAVEIKVIGMPPPRKEALNHDEFEHSAQAHAAASGGMRGESKKPAAIFHGHGGERDTAKKELTQYFRLIDEALRDSLRNEHAPLVLAGVQYVLPIFRSVCSYPKVADVALHGSADHVTDAQLHKRAWPIVQPLLDGARRRAFDKYERLAGTGHASNDVRQIVPAAVAGQVETLFVDHRACARGWFDQRANRAQLHNGLQPEDYDLLGLAAIETVSHRGNVFAVEREQVPGAGQIAAVYRF